MVDTYNSIAILTWWYGPYPWYFSYFLQSCSYNPTVDFFLITENGVSVNNRPQNVKIIYKRLSELVEIASLKLGFEVSVNRPYKWMIFNRPTVIYFSS
jgi:hypothetical protein